MELQIRNAKSEIRKRPVEPVKNAARPSPRLVLQPSAFARGVAIFGFHRLRAGSGGV
jgi:hypothetical protein